MKARATTRAQPPTTHLRPSPREAPSMPTPSKILGIMKPIGGGDPVPLERERLVVGRRASCDICLDFENVSGKHCELHFFYGLWHITDLGSKNGTPVNGL